MNYPIILALNLTKNPQNRCFCALLGSGTAVFGCFEHKIGIFVSEWAIFPVFCVVLSTKSGFLCAFGAWNPRFRPFRAQKWGFCALLDFGIGLQQQHSLFIVPVLCVRLLPWMLMKPIRHYRIKLLSRKLEFDGRW